MDKKKVLAVDDEPTILSAIKDSLSDKYNVLTAKNGKEALKIVEAQDPDLVIMDVMMPEMDGFEAARRLHLKNKFRPVIIFLSAKASLADVEHGLKIGGFEYITKPFSPAKLEAKVDEAFARMETRKHMKSNNNT